MEVEMQAVSPVQPIHTPQQQSSPPQQQQIPLKSPPPHSPAQMPSQVKLTTNFNFQYDDNGNLGRVDVSKALCYQSQEIANNNVVTKKVLVMHQKKTPILIGNGEQSPPQQQQQHEQNQQPPFIDFNNNSHSHIAQQQQQQVTLAPPTIIEAQQLPQPIFAPKTVNGHFLQPQQPPFINHLSWNPPPQF
jgi:hypothetical protein